LRRPSGGSSDAGRGRKWLAFGEKLRGLTLEDTLYAARAEVEKRGY